MDKEFLEDYEKREWEEGERFVKRASKGRLSKTEVYPPRERFFKLSQPLAWAAPGGVTIWPQIPLCGSLLLWLFPVSKSNFSKLHGFDVSDIDRLVDFAKDTGKVQFLIDWPPTAFEGLNFLDPIFQELRPPALFVLPSPPEMQPEIEKYCEEFDTLAGIKFEKYLRWKLQEDQLKTGWLVKALHDYRSDYCDLKIMGLHDVADYLGNLMIADPPLADHIFSSVAGLVTTPIRDPTRAERNFGLKFLTEAISGPNLIKQKAKKATFPCEIGNFFLKKLTLFPEGFESCRDLIAKYKQEDLYRVMISLSEGVKIKQPELARLKASELSYILDNIWKDADRIKKEVTALQYGIPLSMAVIGTMAGPVGTAGGLLAGLGFSVAEKILDWSASSVSEKIAKWLNEDWLVNVYDFKKKILIRS